jgi:hypothetical protein
MAKEPFKTAGPGQPMVTVIPRVPFVQHYLPHDQDLPKIFQAISQRQITVSYNLVLYAFKNYWRQNPTSTENFAFPYFLKSHDH